MDEVIYEEFKGTGNSRSTSTASIAEKRVFPAININRSGTRREELLTAPDELQKMWILRKLLHPMDELAAIEFLLTLGRPDVLPVDDYGVRCGFRIAYRKRELPAPKRLAAFGERWAPHRSTAAWYLWRAVDLHREGRWPVSRS
jgi:hypothetical protein